MTRFFPLTIVIAALAVSGCASRQPVLYPDAHLDTVGQAAAERDVTDCKRLADARARSSSGIDGGEVARRTVITSGTGAAAGAAGGAVYGSAGRGAAAGAAGGAAAGLLQGLLTSRREPSAAYKSLVEACLAERGYRVVGWE